MRNFDYDRALLDMMQCEDCREDYADSVIDDIIEELSGDEPLEDGEFKDVVDNGTIDDTELGG